MIDRIEELRAAYIEAKERKERASQQLSQAFYVYCKTNFIHQDQELRASRQELLRMRTAKFWYEDLEALEKSCERARVDAKRAYAEAKKTAKAYAQARQLNIFPS